MEMEGSTNNNNEINILHLKYVFHLAFVNKIAKWTQRSGREDENVLCT